MCKFSYSNHNAMWAMAAAAAVRSLASSEDGPCPRIRLHSSLNQDVRFGFFDLEDSAASLADINTKDDRRMLYQSLTGYFMYRLEDKWAVSRERFSSTQAGLFSVDGSAERPEDIRMGTWYAMTEKGWQPDSSVNISCEEKIEDACTSGNLHLAEAELCLRAAIGRFVGRASKVKPAKRRKRRSKKHSGLGRGSVESQHVSAESLPLTTLQLRLANVLYRRNNPREADANVARLQEASGLYEDALRLGAGLLPDSTVAAIWHQYGDLLALARRYTESEAVQNKALLLDPGHAGAMLHLGRTLQWLHRGKEALPVFERAVALGHCPSLLQRPSSYSPEVPLVEPPVWTVAAPGKKEPYRDYPCLVRMVKVLRASWPSLRYEFEQWSRKNPEAGRPDRFGYANHTGGAWLDFEIWPQDQLEVAFQNTRSDHEMEVNDEEKYQQKNKKSRRRKKQHGGVEKNSSELEPAKSCSPHTPVACKLLNKLNMKDSSEHDEEGATLLDKLNRNPAIIDIYNAEYSYIGPKGHVLPHAGSSNTKLTVHLPLILPCSGSVECSRLRVGDQIYAYREGEPLIFDDSFEHEVWNDAENESRVTLWMFFAHPWLTSCGAAARRSKARSGEL